MKSTRLVDFFKNGNVVIPIFLLKNYKKFKITIEDFVFLMYLYHFGERFLFDPKKYSAELNLDMSSIMNYIGNLTDKGLIRVEVLKNDKGLMEEVVLLEDFFQKLSLMTIDEVNHDNNTVNSSIFDIIEKEFGRTLSPIEYEIIKAWLDSNISEDLIKEAIKEATFNGVSNLRYIDKILYEWGKSGFKSVQDVENMRKKRNSKIEKNDDVDLDIVDWNWFDDE